MTSRTHPRIHIEPAPEAHHVDPLPVYDTIAPYEADDE